MMYVKLYMRDIAKGSINIFGDLPGVHSISGDESVSRFMNRVSFNVIDCDKSQYHH